MSAEVRGESPTFPIKARIALFAMIGLISCVVALGIYPGHGLSEESAACEQYGCATDLAPAEILWSAEPTGRDSASARSTASAIAEETRSIDQANIPTAVDQVASVSSNASTSAGSGEATPAEASTIVTAVTPTDANELEQSGWLGGTDQSSSEAPTASQRPISEDFHRYWEPPDDPQQLADPYGHVVEHCRVGGLLGRPDPHCGLDNVAKNYECSVYYDTAYGTIRGCAAGEDINDYYSGRPILCSERLHLYDETGNVIGTVNSCPKLRIEECREERCGQRVPRGFSCRREHWNFGELYGGERQTLIRCADPRLDRFFNGELPLKECKGKLLAAVYDEQGKMLDSVHCGPGGSGGDAGEWAGFPAAAADEALNGGASGDEAGNSANSPPQSGVRELSRIDLETRPDDTAFVSSGSNTKVAYEAPDNVSGQGEPSSLGTFFSALLEVIGDPSNADRVATESTNTGAADASDGSGIATVADFMSENRSGVQMRKKARTKEVAAVVSTPLVEPRTQADTSPETTKPNGSTSLNGKTVSGAYQLKIGAWQRSERLSSHDHKANLGAVQAGATALTDVLGENLGRAPSASVRGVRVEGGFGWEKTALMMLGIVGGFSVFLYRGR